MLTLDSRSLHLSLSPYLTLLFRFCQVPRVFIKGRSVGGCDDTFRLHNSGELKKQLDEALA